MPKYRVGLAMPTRHHVGLDAEAYALGVAMKAAQGDEDIDIQPAHGWMSLLTFNFNTLWAGLLNRRDEVGLTHFAMTHDDIIPEAGWLVKLIDELERNDADIVSAIVPIKDERGAVSTAIDDTGDIWTPRRLTLHEVHRMPETFTHPAILLNTGLWVCRMDRPWVDKVCFRQADKIEVNAGGLREVHTIPEDWDFSRQVRDAGGTRLFATRRVKLYHERREWTNARPWGTWHTDMDLIRESSGVPQSRRVAV